MLRICLVPMLFGAVLLSATPAFAQTAPTTAKTTKTNAPVQRTAKSLDCSKQADAKGLHGRARKHFMSGCKKA